MKLLLVSSRFPWPPWRGNQLRTIQWLDAMADHERRLICPATGDGAAAADRGVELRLMPGVGVASAVGVGAAVLRGRPVQEGLYASAAGKDLVTETVRDWQPDVAVVQMVRCGWAVDAIRQTGSGMPIIFDAIDCMALHYLRASSSVGALIRPVYRWEAERCRRRETELVAAAAVSTAVSGRDLRALGADARGMVVTVAGGTDVASTDQSDGEPVVLLSGNLGYRPTVRSALWFADRVWPRVRDRVPSARLVLAGARPAKVVRRLASDRGVEVFGDVDDLGAFLARARVAIAPMASGSGVPIKIIEAMAAGVPVVADPWSAGGLEDPSAVVVADGEVAWVESLCRLLDDPVEARRQAARGAEVWRTHYAPDRVASRIREATAAAVSWAG
jgi:glycosyltransferase involved in cell wall biosynthesis